MENLPRRSTSQGRDRVRQCPFGWQVEHNCCVLYIGRATRFPRRHRPWKNQQQRETEEGNRKLKLKHKNIETRFKEEKLFKV